MTNEMDTLIVQTITPGRLIRTNDRKVRHERVRTSMTELSPIVTESDPGDVIRGTNQFPK